IIGNVCMDMLMIDVTNVACKEGDEVVVFGENPTASEFAATAGTISYEILTAISQRIRRKIVY
ncbi:MAG: alanine racemase C-terminal domain-containing protein, partial [Galbibacter orientalis]